jgi:type IV secretion system protein VirD4
MSWGPRPAVPPRPEPSGCGLFFLIFLILGAAAFCILMGIATGTYEGPRINWTEVQAAFLTFAGVVAASVVLHRVVSSRRRRRSAIARIENFDGERIANAPDPFTAARECAWRYGGGAFLGFMPDTGDNPDAGSFVGAAPENAVLIIAPPRAGKTAGVIIPSILVSPGAVVSTSTKGDVMGVTCQARRLQGRVWLFDPTGTEELPPGVQQLRWSPVTGAENWDTAMLTADSMVNAMASFDREVSGHFEDKAKELLSVLLHAAARSGVDITEVVRWTAAAATPETARVIGDIFEGPAAAGDESAAVAYDVYLGLLRIADRERASIISTTGRVLRVYQTLGARRTAREPNLDPAEFVRSRDTIYITAPSDRQALYAPMIVGLLEQIRYAQYARHAADLRAGRPPGTHVTFLLDEVSNIAPIPLPQIVSEAGGQGLHVVAVLQDLSQARNRWGEHADGLLTLFRVKYVLHGIVEARTLEALSQAVGEYDRLSVSYGVSQMGIQETVSTTHSIQRQRVLSPGEIAQVPAGFGLLMNGAQWGVIRAAPYFAHPTWQAVLAAVARAGRLSSAGSDLATRLPYEYRRPDQDPA